MSHGFTESEARMRNGVCTEVCCMMAYDGLISDMRQTLPLQKNEKRDPVLPGFFFLFTSTIATGSRMTSREGQSSQDDDERMREE